jgi:hypothetical protein
MDGTVVLRYVRRHRVHGNCLRRGQSEPDMHNQRRSLVLNLVANERRDLYRHSGRAQRRGYERTVGARHCDTELSA